ncbi:MAG TPA: TonB-dependent receptor [Rhodanobacteraceae bacterium]|jgi:outer membrane receptor protein involved in Fe transport|nr:TonB-dependent receptor [Rhodanobacteraceae bacterium]
MNNNMNRLSLAVRVALTAGLITAAGMAQAQQPAAPDQQSAAAAPQSQPAEATNTKGKIKTLQTMVVTGSLIRRVDTETASPVTVIDRQNITNSGNLTLGNVLQQLPSIAGNATNTHNNSNGGGVASPLTEGGDGASRVSLRGLGTGRTLVLINGQRMLNADMNLIPQNMIERIDVLAEGASTTYGSDAVGGVVNIILRKNFEGAELSLNDGISSHGDGQRHGFSLTLGHSGEKFSLVGGLDYNKYDAVPATRRDFSKEQMYLYGGVVTVFGSSSIPSGRMQIPTDTSLPFAQRFSCPDTNQVTLASGDGTSMDDYRCRTPSDTFNYAAYNYLQTSQQRTDGFVLGSYNLTDNVTAFIDAFYNHTESAGQDASSPVGTGDGLIIPATAPFNPFGVTFSAPGAVPNDPNSGYTFQTRLTGVGTRIHPYTTSTGQVITGVRGAFGETWNWNVTLDYGHTARTQRDENELSIPALQAAIDSGVNIFDQANAKGLDAGAVTATYQKYEILRQISAGANGDIFSLPAGPVQLAVGALYRKQSLNYTVDSFVVLNPVTATCGILQEACGSPGRGNDSVKEAFAETLIPLLKDVPGAYSLNVDLGVRHSDYDSAGSTTNGKIAIEWRPIQDLLVRGTISQVFRAPNLDQLYDGRSLVQPNLNDPCVGLTAAELSQHANACQFVPVNWGGNDIAQVNTYYSGANVVGAKLKPEHGKSVDLGLVYNPSWAPGLNTSLDFWHIYLYDTLVAIDGRTVVNSCFNNNSSRFCSFIHRYDDTTQTPGQVFYIDTPVSNLGTLSTSGIDFTINYKLPHFNFGSFNPGDFKAGLATSYISTFNNDATPGAVGSTVEKLAGTWNAQFGNISRWRATATLGWNRGNWDAQWRTRYISGVTALNADYITNASLQVASVVYSDLQLGYTVPAIHTRFDVGADNVFNRLPPLIYQNGQMNTDTLTYDVMGRYYWARATLKF